MDRKIDRQTDNLAIYFTLMKKQHNLSFYETTTFLSDSKTIGRRKTPFFTFLGVWIKKKVTKEN